MNAPSAARGSEAVRKRSWATPVGDEVVPGRRVLARLGGGRRTEVYRCTDDAHGASVVVKVLRPGRTGERDVRMLRREARALAALDHPGFPALLDDDLRASPAWIVMSQADGTHLSRLVRERGVLGIEEAVGLARDLAGALDHLHGRGRVHLDVKPSNVVVGRRGMLLDLGASRTVERAARLSAGVGTWSAMSPEQADPETFGPPSPASDLWGLGITLVLATTQAKPLAARRDASAAVDEAVLAAACRAAAAGVPEPLRPVVLACLATSPAARPDAREVIDMLADR